MTDGDRERAFSDVTEALVALIRALGRVQANPVAVDLGGPEDGLRFLQVLPSHYRAMVEVRRFNYDRGIEVDQVEVCGVLVRWPVYPRARTDSSGLGKLVR